MRKKTYDRNSLSAECFPVDDAVLFLNSISSKVSDLCVVPRRVTPERLTIKQEDDQT
jgi:hypothetical protein